MKMIKNIKIEIHNSSQVESILSNKTMLTQELIDGSHQYDVPEETLDGEVADLIAKIEEIPGFNPHVEFDPAKHIIFKEEDFDKTRKLTLSELNIPKTHVAPTSDVAVTDPFPLLSTEAVNIMKWETFQKDTIKRFGRLPRFGKGSTRTDFQMGGHSRYVAPFSYAFWNHPRTLEILSKFTGIAVQPQCQSECNHINASLVSKSASSAVKLTSATPKELLSKTKEDKIKEGEEIKSVVGWHYDSNPFVCVLMLSAPEGMVGGETGLRSGDESVVRVPDPKPGYATILQGRVIRHIATKPESNAERISSCTGLIPSDPEVFDSSWSKSIRPSALPRATNDVFYPDWFEYRFERMEKRLKNHRLKLLEAAKKGEKFDQWKTINFCKDIEKYLTESWNEMEAVYTEEFPLPLFSVPYSDLPDIK